VNAESRQRGATLVVVLIMLAVITLFVVSMVRLSNTNMAVVGNMQEQRRLEAAAQQAIEDKISSITYFNDAINGTGTWAGGVTSVNTTVDGYTVTLSKPTCIYYQTAEGYSATSPISPEDTYWEQTVTSTDTAVSGASVTLTQGLKMRLTAGNCG
jgi:Tfp pilus assembly protein PilX